MREDFPAKVVVLSMPTGNQRVALADDLTLFRAFQKQVKDVQSGPTTTHPGWLEITHKSKLVSTSTLVRHFFRQMPQSRGYGYEKNKIDKSSFFFSPYLHTFLSVEFRRP